MNALNVEFALKDEQKYQRKISFAKYDKPNVLETVVLSKTGNYLTLLQQILYRCSDCFFSSCFFAVY